MYHICHLDRSPFRIFQLQLCNRYYFSKGVSESFRIRVFWYRFFLLNGPNGKANIRNSLIHILNCCIFCCYIMTLMWWTFSLQPNQTHLWWKSDAFMGRWSNRTCLGNRTRLCNRTHLWVLHIYFFNTRNLNRPFVRFKSRSLDHTMMSDWLVDDQCTTS
jgi:hypothetical protein